MASPHSPNQNHLLAALPTAEFERLVAHLELVPLPLGEMLYQPGTQLQHAYFPTTAIVSLHYVMATGASSESAGVGNEGVVGISLFMGGDTTPSSAVVQTGGHAYRLERSKLLEQTVEERTAELRESEARYRSLTELASDWYWEQDEHGTFTKVSGPVLEMLGIQVDSLAGDTSKKQLEGWNEEQRKVLQDTIAARQPFLDFVFNRVKSDGSQQTFRVSGEPMFNQSARFIGYRGIGVEFTHSK